MWQQCYMEAKAMWTLKPWAVPGASAKPRSRHRGGGWSVLRPLPGTQDSARDLPPPIRSLGQESWEMWPSPGLALNMNLQHLLSLGNFWKVCWFKVISGISMMVQWLGLHLPMGGRAGSIPVWGAKIPHALDWVKKAKTEQKQYCHKFNKDF